MMESRFGDQPVRSRPCRGTLGPDAASHWATVAAVGERAVWSAAPCAGRTPRS